MNVSAIRSDGIYEKIMLAPDDKKNDIYRYGLMMPFERKWVCYNVPMKAKTPGGYDVIIASRLLGHIEPTKVDEAQKQNILLIPNEYTLEHLPVALAHEANHNIRFPFIEWKNDITLGEMMISEGLAEDFASK